MADENDKQETTTETEDKGVHSALSSLLEKHGDYAKVALKLHEENFKLREDRRKLREQMPSKDAVVLTGDEAKAWNTYRELGKPEDLRGLKQKADEAEQKVTRFERSAHLDAVAEAARVKPSVLKTLAGDLAFEIKEEDAKDEKGEKTRKKVVYVKDGDAEPVEFTKAVDSRWADFKDALYPKTDDAPARPIGSPTRGPLRDLRKLASTVDEQPKRSLPTLVR